MRKNAFLGLSRDGQNERHALLWKTNISIKTIKKYFFAHVCVCLVCIHVFLICLN